MDIGYHSEWDYELYAYTHFHSRGCHSDVGNVVKIQRNAVRTGPSNRPPEPVGSLAALVTRVGEAAVTVDVSGAFRDPDGTG